MSSERILVTGGCGFIGTNLVIELLQKGFSDVTILDRAPRRPDSTDLNGRVELVEMDLNSPRLSQFVAQRKFTTVIHLAAIHYIPYCNSHAGETWEVNVKGTQALLQACVSHGVECLFLASSAAVYKPAPGAHTETDRLGPTDIYGLAKLTNERQVQNFASRSNSRFVIGRIFNAVGRYETNPHLVPEVIKRLRVSSRIEIGNTASKRDYIHVRDICRAIVTMTFRREPGVHVVNIGTGNAYDALEVIQLLAKIMDKLITLQPSQKHMRPVDRPMLKADRAKLKLEYGWEPVYTLEEALRDALEDNPSLPRERTEFRSVPEDRGAG